MLLSHDFDNDLYEEEGDDRDYVKITPDSSKSSDSDEDDDDEETESDDVLTEE